MALLSEEINREKTREGLINNPDISSSGKPQTRAITSIEQAREVVKVILQADTRRMTVNSRITSKYNAERPFLQKKLEAEGLGWKHNFTTKPLPMMVDKVAPRFDEAIQSMKYLTNSSLPASIPGNSVKTEKFREGITKLVRSRREWKTLIEDIAQENALFGFTGVAWLDEFTWFPQHFKQNEFFVSDGTKQLVSTAQVVVLREVFLPDALFRMIKDQEEAEAVGWNLVNTVEAINNASPNQYRMDLASGTGITTDAAYQNMERQLSVGCAYMAGASVIEVYSLLVKEISGKVSHYRLAGKELKEIFSRDDRFDSMEDCVAFFAFQKGDGTMHGSKGIGRDIYELAAMLDRARNEAVDRLMISGKTLFQGDPRNLHRFRMSIIGSACIVPLGWTLLEHKIDGNVDPFIKLDSYFDMLLNQLIGSTSMPRMEGEAFRSPEAWKLLASREEEGKDSRISRFIRFFVDMMATIQRRICNPDTVEEDAKKFQKDMLKIMPREELDMLANMPIAETVRDLTQIERQLIVQVAAEKRGNPLYNQRELEYQDMVARIGPEFAERVLAIQNDPAEEAEQSRLQQLELVLLSNGTPVPVSPRDNHAVHLKILMPVMEQIANDVSQGKAGTQLFEVLLAHVNEHVTRAKEAGQVEGNEILQQAVEFMKQAPKVLAQLRELDQQAAVLADQSDQLAAEDAGVVPAQ